LYIHKILIIIFFTLDEPRGNVGNFYTIHDLMVVNTPFSLYKQLLMEKGMKKHGVEYFGIYIACTTEGINNYIDYNNQGI